MKFFVFSPVALVPFQLAESSSAFARAVGESALNGGRTTAAVVVYVRPTRKRVGRGSLGDGIVYEASWSRRETRTMEGVCIYDTRGGAPAADAGVAESAQGSARDGHTTPHTLHVPDAS